MTIKKRHDTKQKCPICYNLVIKPNVWVKYHIRYSDPISQTGEITIIACKFCNFTEFCLRNSIITKHKSVLSRIDKVIAFHKRFGIKL